MVGSTNGLAVSNAFPSSLVELILTDCTSCAVTSTGEGLCCFAGGCFFAVTWHDTKVVWFTVSIEVDSIDLDFVAICDKKSIQLPVQLLLN